MLSKKDFFRIFQKNFLKTGYLKKGKSKIWSPKICSDVNKREKDSSKNYVQKKKKLSTNRILKIKYPMKKLFRKRRPLHKKCNISRKIYLEQRVVSEIKRWFSLIKLCLPENK